MKNAFLTTAILLAMIAPAQALEIGAGANSALQVKTPGISVDANTHVNADASAGRSYRKPEQKEYDTTKENAPVEQPKDSAESKPQKKNGFSLYGEGSFGASGNNSFDANTETRTSGAIGAGSLLGGSLTATSETKAVLR